jgi:translation elongation factor EF-Tu-like GTPase
MDTVPIVEVEIDLLPTASSGRAISLRAYRPFFRAKSGDVVAVEFFEPSDEAVEPGEGVTAVARLMYSPGVNYDAFADGASFEILEGSNVVGDGQVIRHFE